MLMKKSIGVALACGLALGAWSGSTLATPINVMGVHWDSSSPFDLTIQSLNLRESSISAVGDVLTGYGQIGSINGNNSFCTGCDLTFTFSSTVTKIAGNQVVFDSASFQFYVAAAGSFDFGNPASASLGSAWATLTGHTFINPSTLDVGQIFGSINGTPSNPTLGSGGFGLMDATGGAAKPFLNSNSMDDGNGGWADFALTSSYLTKAASGCTSISPDPSNICHYPIEGNGSLIGATAVPEPGALGLLGFGLTALGFLTWRRRKEA